jgi:hypothetical protein
MINLFVIVLSVSLTVENHFTINLSYFDVYKQVCLYALSICTIVRQYTKYEEVYSLHKNAADRFSAIYRSLQQVLSNSRRERIDAKIYMTSILKEFDDLCTNSIILDKKTIAKYKEKYNIEQEKNNQATSTMSGSNVTNIRDINKCVIDCGEITDEQVNQMEKNNIDKLNKKYIERSLEYEYSRLRENS